MLVEVGGALTAGLLASSYALIAFGSDSLIELLSAFVVLRHLKLDNSGSKALGEKTALFASFLLIALVPLIGVGSSYSFFELKTMPRASILGLAIAIGAVVVMPILWTKKKQIGRETGCLPLSIDAIESATCFLMSVALLGGLLLELVFHIGWFDYIATLVILAFVAFEARESLQEARNDHQSRISSLA
ncbi:MAG: cation transporter [Nitrososphaerales archaeon]